MSWILHLFDTHFFLSGTAVLADIGNIPEMKMPSCTVTSSSVMENDPVPLLAGEKITHRFRKNNAG